METVDLVLAAQVRTLAQDLRSAARSLFYGDVYKRCEEAQRVAKLAAWEIENPLELYVHKALAEITDVARIITQRNSVK